MLAVAAGLLHGYYNAKLASLRAVADEGGDEVGMAAEPCRCLGILRSAWASGQPWATLLWHGLFF